MKKLIAILFLYTASFAQTDAIEALERQRFTAQSNKNMDVLDKVFADDLIYTHSNGNMDTKVSYLQSIQDGKSRYEKVDIEDIKVRYYHKKTALVNGQVMIKNSNADGTVQSLHLKYVVLYIKKPKTGWQLVMWQSSKLPN